LGIHRIYVISCDICSHWHEFEYAPLRSASDVEKLAPGCGFVSAPRGKLAIDAITRGGYKVPRQTPRVWLCQSCARQYLRYPANVEAAVKLENARAAVEAAEAKIPKVSLSEVSRRAHEQQDAR